MEDVEVFRADEPVFRAKRLDNGEWVEGGLFTNADQTKTCIIKYGDKNMTPIYVSAETVARCDDLEQVNK